MAQHGIPPLELPPSRFPLFEQQRREPRTLNPALQDSSKHPPQPLRRQNADVPAISAAVAAHVSAPGDVSNVVVDVASPTPAGLNAIPVAVLNHIPNPHHRRLYWTEALQRSCAACIGGPCIAFLLALFTAIVVLYNLIKCDFSAASIFFNLGLYFRVLILLNPCFRATEEHPAPPAAPAAGPL